MIILTLAVLTFFFTVFTFLPLLRSETWWIRILDFPRLQLICAVSLLLIAQFSLLDLSLIEAQVIIVFNFSNFLYQSWWILPFTKFFPVEVKTSYRTVTSHKIRIITANVLTTNTNYEGFLDLIEEHQPDIFVTLESDINWQKHLDKLEENYTYSVKCPQDNLYGMHVYSMLPLKNSALKFLIEPDVPSIHADVVLASGQHVRMHFLHPTPPVPTENTSSIERDAELVMIGKEAAKTDKPVIVTGDLNDVAWSETTRLFRKISGLLDPRVGRGMYNTFHSDYWFIRWPLDYFFHSSHFTITDLLRLPPFGSDHFAILIELAYDVDKKTVQESIPATAEDEKHAAEKVENVK